MKYIISFLLIFVMAEAAYCQTENQKKRGSIDLSLSLRGNIDFGNFERFNTDNKLNINWQSADQRWNFLSSSRYRYQQLFGNQTHNDLFSRNILENKLSAKTSWISAFFLAKDRNKRHNYYIQYGGGLRYNVASTDYTLVKVGLVFTRFSKKYEDVNFENFEITGSPFIKGFYFTPELNMRFKSKSKNLKFDFIGYFQQDLAFNNNYRWSFTSTMAVKISKNIDFTMSVTDRYEHVILQGIEKNDFSIVYGIQVHFQRKVSTTHNKS